MRKIKTEENMSHKFTIGEYLTRGGEKATVAFDWSDHGVNNDYPLIGYFTDEKTGRKFSISWSENGHVLRKNPGNSGDLVPPAPKMVKKPISIDEIPVGTHMRLNGGGMEFLIIKKWNGNLYTSGEGVWNTAWLSGNGAEYREDWKSEWKPFWREVPASE